MRVAKLTDVDAIMELECGSIAHPWQRGDIVALIEDDNKIALVEEDSEGAVLGYVGADWVIPEANIGNIVVRRDCRGKGFGRTILKALLEELHEVGNDVVFLEVESDNLPARVLYEKTGFEVYNQRKNYYGEGRDALLMRFRL